MYGAQQRPPPGWNPPFTGPPPMPQGMNVKPQDWSAGQWQFNPAFKPTAKPAQPWIPGQWPQQQQQQQQQQPPQQQQQQQQQANPFQRPSKPPSQAYLMMPVKTNNALDLFEMVPRNELYKGSADAPHTPWIWNPRGLVEDEEEAGIIQADFRDAHGRTVSRESRGATPTRRRSVNQSTSPSPSPLRHQRHHSHSSTPTRQASEPGPSQRQIYAPSAAPAPPAHRATEPTAVPHEFQTEEPLRPTFSSSIVRIPDHYRDSPAGKRSSTRSSSVDNSHLSSRNADADLASRMNQMSTSTGIVRHSSMPSQAFQEPVLLSPLILSEPTAARPLGRHHTQPALSVIPESSSSTSSSTVKASRSRGPSRAPSPISSSSSPTSHASSPHRTPHSSASPRNHNPLPTPPREITYNLSPYQSKHSQSAPPHAAASRPASHAHQQAGSRSASHVLQQPGPSRSSSHKTHHASSRSASQTVQPASSSTNTSSQAAHALPTPTYSQPPVPRSSAPPPSSPRRVRKGWWNSRGDHLTNSGNVVYCPVELTHPRDLRDYPKQGMGWKNEEGRVIEHNTLWTELEDSLPRMGRKPLRPYDSFISYVERSSANPSPSKQ